MKNRSTRALVAFVLTLGVGAGIAASMDAGSAVAGQRWRTVPPVTAVK